MRCSWLFREDQFSYRHLNILLIDNVNTLWGLRISTAGDAGYGFLTSRAEKQFAPLKQHLLCSSLLNLVTLRNVGVNIFWITRRLFSALRAPCPLDMLVNVFLLGMELAIPTVGSCAHHEPHLPIKSPGNAGNETQVGAGKDGKKERERGVTYSSEVSFNKSAGLQAKLYARDHKHLQKASFFFNNMPKTTTCLRLTAGSCFSCVLSPLKALTKHSQCTACNRLLGRPVIYSQQATAEEYLGKKTTVMLNNTILWLYILYKC